MQVFSEKVNHTSTNGFLNIIKTESFEEIFYDVFEVQINGNKYPLEKISEYEGNPVVSVPVFVEDQEIFFPFVLVKGKQEIIFNENNTLDTLLLEGDVDLIKEKTIVPVVEEAEEPIIDESSPRIEYQNDKRSEILEEIKRSKREALEYANNIKEEKIQEAKKIIKKDNRILEQTLEDARSGLVEDFLNISKKIKEDLFDLSNDSESKLSKKIDDKINTISEDLKKSLSDDFNESSKHFDKNVRSVIKELYQSIVIPKVNSELKSISTDIVEKVSEIEAGLYDKLDETLGTKADKTLIESINEEVRNIQKLNVELNDNINKGVSKALSRVGKVSKEFETFSEEIDKRINESAQEISDYYTERVEFLETQALDLNDKTRQYFIGLIEESRDNLIEEIRKTKEESPIEYIVEAMGKKDPEVVSIDKLKKEYDKIIHDKFENYKVDLRKYITVYGGGGSGTVAMQFADGGTMNGDLTVVGSISASQYLGLSIPSGDYLPLSGGTITGDLAITGDITTVDSIQFDTAAGVTVGVGQMAWNDADGTLDIGMKGGNVTLQVGQEQFIRVVNKTGDDLLESQYKVVRVRTQAEGGAQGQRLAVKLAQANTKANHTGILGVVTENINNNQEGFITTFGQVRGINTTGSLQGETWRDGDAIWLSETVAGGLTNIQPTNHPVQIGYVEYAHANNGKILVSVQNGVDELGELHDVKITNLSANDILSYNASSGVWHNTRDLVVDSLSANVINALSANITVIDIKQYELSGFNVQGNATVQGTISATGPIYANGNQVATVVDPVRTTLTGNGVLSTFAISGANTLVNPSALIVAIDGALQSPSIDYTVNNGVITFTSPVPSGSTAVVISPLNVLQTSQMIPSDGSVTSNKLDTNINIIGTLSVGGDIEATLNTRGVVIRSPNNSRWRITVSNSGILSATAL